MKTIVEGKANVCKLLGKQRVKTGTKYRLIKYVLRAECKDGTLLHNVITGQLVLLSSEQTQALETLPAEARGILNELIKEYFLVPIEYEDKEIVYQLRKIMKRLFQSNGISSYTILTTTNCNARCFYCYQSNITHVNMSSETADKVINYMLSHRSNEPLHLKWFGGEPLVGIARIDQICRALRKNKVEYTSSMISNGFLFDEETIRKAVHLWKLKRIQITLDGTMEVYNRTKAYVSNDSNPYCRVINNIKLLLENGIYVVIRLNLDSHNQNDLGNLVEDLQVNFGTYKNIGLYTHVLFENEGFSPLKRDKAITRSLYDSQDQLRKRIDREGLSVRRERLPSLKTHSCMADSDNAVCIFPDGRLYKCEHTEEGDEFGSIDSAETLPLNIMKFKETYETRNCRECPLFPKCVLLKNCIGTQSFFDENVCKYNVETAIQSMVYCYDSARSICVSM